MKALRVVVLLVAFGVLVAFVLAGSASEPSQLGPYGTDDACSGDCVVVAPRAIR